MNDKDGTLAARPISADVLRQLREHGQLTDAEASRLALDYCEQLEAERAVLRDALAWYAGAEQHEAFDKDGNQIEYYDTDPMRAITALIAALAANAPDEEGE